MKTFTHIDLNRVKKLAFFCVSLTLIFSCEKKSTEPVKSNDYFPLEVGRYLIYDVREEIYSTGKKDPLLKVGQEKDEIEAVSKNAEGISTYTFSRSTRISSTDYWQKLKRFTVQKFPDKILTNIDNQTFVTLVFPAYQNLKWNGNTFNNLDPEEYYYENINAPETIGEQSFAQSLTVVERQDTSIINKYVGIKQYGLGVGLISDSQTSFEFCQTDECIGSGKIDSGTRKVRKIIEYGINK
ncbi:hypothetical protein [Dyadobacter arcticus]|uniref:Lipoprotein n=1 Tax=Dyadobacter arcticus TaxID=1078754 RepID=A0ABX0UG75_9BACT|nr:hypothetical protein [Dyadobacter arcticus]NIJ51508.1 hypothetical protein [Dyadobacter arcticus]